jgi:hypothetical protein
VGIIAFCKTPHQWEIAFFNFFLYKWDGWVALLMHLSSLPGVIKLQVDITARTSLFSFCSQWCNALLGGHCCALYDKKESEDDECVCPPSSNYGMNYTTFKQLWSVANTTSRLAFSFKGKKSSLHNNCSAHFDVISWFLDDL